MEMTLVHPVSKYCFLRADAAEQLEQSRLEMATFQQLKITETAAIPRRLETLTQVNLTKLVGLGRACTPVRCAHPSFWAH
jgi:hypothetical protein